MGPWWLRLAGSPFATRGLSLPALHRSALLDSSSGPALRVGGPLGPGPSDQLQNLAPVGESSTAASRLGFALLDTPPAPGWVVKLSEGPKPRGRGFLKG